MSKIEWTDRTWNPVVGCNIVSKGCDNCYAMKMAARLEAMGQEKYMGLTRKTDSGRMIWTGKISMDEKALLEPLKRKKATMYFVDSMGDLFHEGVPFHFIDKVFAVMALTPQHTYQVLTKRPERMAEYFNRPFMNPNHYWGDYSLELPDSLEKKYRTTILNGPDGWKTPLPNVWLGTSVEDQKTADERIPHLLKVPAKVRFLSCEPLLGAIDLTKFFYKMCGGCGARKPDDRCMGCMHPFGEDSAKPFDQKAFIHWVIAGGESGSGARPMHPDWVRGLRDQCESAGVSFFFKQWGAWKPTDQLTDEDFDWNISKSKNHLFEDYTFTNKVGKHRAGNVLDGRTHLEFPV